MTREMLAVASLFLAVAHVSVGSVELHLESMKAEQPASDMPDLRITLINKRDGAIFVSPGFLTLSMEINDGSGWRSCKPVLEILRAVVDSDDWRSVAARTAFVVAARRFPCVTRDFREFAQDWNMVPATYQLRVTMNHRLADTATALGHNPWPGAFDEVLLSNVINLIVTVPQGPDTAAFEWLKRNQHDAMSPEVAARFPASTYAAKWDFQFLSLSAAEPSQVRDLIDRSLFLSWNSVPGLSAPNFLRPVVGVELGRWRVSRGQQILREHPSFPYSDWIRLAVAVNHFALGDRRGIEQLESLAESDSREVSGWAARFLAAGKNASPQPVTAASPACRYLHGRSRRSTISLPTVGIQGIGIGIVLSL